MNYYATAKKASSQINGHSGLEFLHDHCLPGLKILDIGCGEGTRLNTLLPSHTRGWGIDPSPQAINMAKTQYPRHYFSEALGEKLPFKNNFFDLVYSAFAIEHCHNPEAFLSEMIRVVKKGGLVIILAPNYGAPNRRSPVSSESPVNKFFEGLIKSIFPPPTLGWTEVTPTSKYTQVDSDTTYEPYLLSLQRFLTFNNLTIKQCNSLWSLEPHPSNFYHWLFLTLGQLGISPFTMWGPQVFICALK
jgi:SAM-dependent methyltransferase